MTNQADRLHRRSRRRGQKQHGNDGPKPPLSNNIRPVNSQADSIQMHIQKLDRAKRRIRGFNKVALCVAALCVGNNIYTILSNRRHGGIGLSFLWGEAFQYIHGVYGKNRSNNRQWSLFGNRRDDSQHLVPKEFLRDFGSYPNILNITAQMRKEFHPVVKIPLRKKGENDGKVEEGTCNESESQKRSFWPWQKQNRNNDFSCIDLERKMNETFDYIIKDYTENEKNDRRVLLEGGKRVPQLLPTREEALAYAKLPKQSKKFDVGRYDEDRRGMYTSSLFGEEESKQRTIHIGIDVGAPVGTPVHAFEEGIVHSAGYNPDVGDYGHVIVIEHHLKNHNDEITKVYALYGHLSAKSIHGKHPGQKIKRGQTIGYLGNTAENGGWTGKKNMNMQ